MHRDKYNRPESSSFMRFIKHKKCICTKFATYKWITIVETGIWHGVNVPSNYWKNKNKIILLKQEQGSIKKCHQSQNIISIVKDQWQTIKYITK